MRRYQKIVGTALICLALSLMGLKVHTSPGSKLGPQVNLWQGGAPVTLPDLGLHHPLPTTYRHATSWDQFYPVNINNWWGYANQIGDLLVYPGYDWADYFYDNLARVVWLGRTGFISKANNIIIPMKFPYADRFAGGMAIVGDGQGHFGFINKAGTFVVPVVLSGALRFSDGLAAVQVDKRIGYVNKAGQVVVRPQLAAGRSFHQNVAMVRFFKNGKKANWGAINQAGKVVWQDKSGTIDFLGSFYDGLAKAKVNKKWGYLARNFRFRIQPRFEEAHHFQNGLAAVKLNGKWGYINKIGQFVIKPQFEKAGEFTGTLAMIKKNGLYGFVNQSGSYYILPRYKKAQSFQEKRARVSMGPSFGYINVAGQITWNPLDPLQGIVDTTLLGQLAARYHRNPPTGNPVFPPPPPKSLYPHPYPPDYQYVDILPQPGGAFGATTNGSSH